MIKLTFILIFMFWTLGVAAPQVSFVCESENSCDFSIAQLKKVQNRSFSLSDLKSNFKQVYEKLGIYNYSWNGAVLKIKQWNRIDSTLVTLNGETYSQKINMPLELGGFLTTEVLKKTNKRIKEHLLAEGYLNLNLKVSQKLKKDKTKIHFDVTSSQKRLVKSIQVNIIDDFVKTKVERAFSSFLKDRYVNQRLAETLDEIKQVLISDGYYFISLLMDVVKIGEDIHLKISAKNIQRQVFEVEGVSKSQRQRIKEDLKATATAYRKIIRKTNIEQVISKALLDDGIISFTLGYKEYRKKDDNKSNIHFSIIKINKQDRVKVQDLIFKGNAFFSDEKLRTIFYENADEKAANKIYSKSYYLNYLKILKREYAKVGFVAAKLQLPQVSFDKRSNKVKIEFTIREGNRARIRELFIKGVSGELADEVRAEVFSYKEDSFFNPVEFEEKLKQLNTFLDSKGYFYAKLNRLSDKEIVKYLNQNTSVDITIDIDLGKKLVLDRVIPTGNIITKDKVLLRENPISAGELVTKEKVREYQRNLLALGLFSRVQVTPSLKKNGKADLFIHTRERKFGLIELAPGFRTDLGPKVSASVAYNNLGGMNRRVKLEAQLNQRFDLSDFDGFRKDSDRFIEFDAELSYSENKLFDTNIDFTTSLSQSRRRLFSFDADIMEIGYTATKKFNSWFSASISQQFEDISQFDSTIEDEEGDFTIGSITPAITFDFRNSRINPTSGSYFNLSFERASPAFFSQDSDDLRIDYYKIISRNFFYIPFKNGVFAMSVAAGMQKNLAGSDGYIPNIKVFRLSGMDIVRGYEDDEINRLINNEDISAERIDNKAYMLNFKLEPRFFINDSMIAGLFIDAGRIFVDKIETNKLRSSVGVSFKYLTPVGTLDFDYGIKILRKEDANGILDSPGRLHVSIGFF